jgi:hypothetical protein
MIDVDRDTERRNARLQFVAQLLLFAVLLYLVTPDKRLYLALMPLLLAVLGYRSWAVERFSPTLAQYYARAAVGGGADAILHVLRAEPYLTDAWARAGVDLRRLFALPPDRVAEAMGALCHDRYPVRRLPGSQHVVNRAVALILGTVLGLALARGVTGTFCGLPLTRLLPALPWPFWLGLVLVVGCRLIVRRDNGQQLARVTAAVRTDPRAELDELLAPPWGGRRQATVAALNRLADHADRTARPLPGPELRTVSLLLAGGIGLGLLAGVVIWAC